MTVVPKRSVWLVAILLALVPVGYAIWLFEKAATMRRIEITPEVSLEMVALLTSSDSAYPRHSTWKQTLFNKLPEMLVDKLPRKWFIAGEAHVNWPLSRDEVMVLTKFTFPEQWNDRNRPLSSTRRIEQSLKQSGIDEVYLKFPHGYESLRRSTYVSHIPKWGASGTTILEGLVFQMPPDVEDFEVHFGGDSVRSKPGSIRLHNPIKNHTRPIAPSPHALPVTITNGGVSVTLRTLMIKVNRAPTTAATTDEPSRAFAVFDIADTNSTPSQWSITDPVAISYGDPDTEFESVSYTKGLPPRQTTEFETDFGMLEQPVRLTVPLTRTSNFPADEKIVRTLSLPEPGKHTDPGDVLNFWDGAVTVFTGNKISFTGTRSTRPSDSLSLLVSSDKVQNRTIPTRLHRAELSTPSNENFDLMPFMERQSNLAHWFITDFNLMQIMSSKSLTEANLNASTLTVTLIRPRKFPHTFEFVAQPTEAAVQMAK